MKAEKVQEMFSLISMNVPLMNIHSIHMVRTNDDASFECAYEAGYAGYGFICSDINECLEENAFDAYTACGNIAGFHVCT